MRSNAITRAQRSGPRPRTPAHERVKRILKEADLITSPAYVLLSASDAFKNPTTRVHEMWQTDFTYFRILNWGWYYLSTVLDDFSRYIIAWKLRATMRATAVTETLDEALAITGVDHIQINHRPRLLSDNVLSTESTPFFA